MKIFREVRPFYFHLRSKKWHKKLTFLFGAPLTKYFQLFNLQFYNEFHENKKACSPLWQDSWICYKYFCGSAFELDLGSQLSVVGIEMLWSDYYLSYKKGSVEGVGVWVGDETAVWADYPVQFFRLVGNFKDHFVEKCISGVFRWSIITALGPKSSCYR